MTELVPGVSTPRARLLPKLGFLAGLELVMIALPKGPELLIGCFCVIITYTAYLVLKTLDMVRGCREALHAWDHAIVRRSGPLAGLIALMLLVVVVCSLDQPVEVTWLSSRPGLFFIKYFMEVGFILAVASLFALPEIEHVSPHWMWRVVAFPLMFIYGAYVILMSAGQFAGDCG